MRSLRVALIALLLAVGVATWFALFDRHEQRAAEVDAKPQTNVEAPEAAEPRVAVEEVAQPVEPPPAKDVQRLASLFEPALAENRLFGVVHPPAGVGALRGTVRVFATDHLGVVEHSQANADGAYWIAGLAPGTHWLLAGSREEGWVRTRVEIPSPARDVELDLQLVAATVLRISVLDGAGQPIEDLPTVPIAKLDPPGDWVDELEARPDYSLGIGRFRDASGQAARWGSAHGGTLALEVEPPLFVSLLNGQRVIATQRVERGQEKVVFVLDRQAPLTQPGSLRFHFVEAATGAPLAVTMAQLQGRGARLMQSKDGAYFVPHTAPGDYEIVAMLDGYECARRRVRVEPGVENDLDAIALGPELSIAGRVVHEDGAGFACRVRVSALDPAGHFFDGSVNNEYPCDPQRGFRVRQLSRALYAVRVVNGAPLADACRIVDLRNGPVESFELVVRRGVPLVLRPSVDDWRGMRLEIRDGDGAFVLAKRISTDAPDPVLLAPGAYTIDVFARTGEPTRVPVTIGEEPVELALP